MRLSCSSVIYASPETALEWSQYPTCSSASDQTPCTIDLNSKSYSTPSQLSIVNLPKFPAFFST
jgi:hypothetical protein